VIKLTDILKETIVKSPQEQMEDFINLEDKVRSSFIGHKKVVAWHSRLKEKYPNLRIKFLKDGDVLRAEADIMLNEAKKEEPKIGAFEEFAGTREKGAEKITKNTKEKGGLSMLTYYHYNVKLPYYKKAAEGKLDLEAAHKEYKDLLKQLHTATKTNMNIEQIAFQKLVGKIEVLGELLIKHK